MNSYLNGCESLLWTTKPSIIFQLSYFLYLSNTNFINSLFWVFSFSYDNASKNRKYQLSINLRNSWSHVLLINNALSYLPNTVIYSFSIYYVLQILLNTCCILSCQTQKGYNILAFSRITYPINIGRIYIYLLKYYILRYLDAWK